MHRAARRLAAHAAAHFAVDFSCFFALWVSTLRGENAAFMVLLYNALAFALQAPLGALCDRLDDARPFTVLGCGLVAWGVLACAFPLPSVILLGLGNALFHVGGAVTSLRHCPGDAFSAGAYVAPGALGVALGTLCGKGMLISPFSAVLLLVACIGFIWFCGMGAPRACVPNRTPSPMEHLGTAAIMLCLVSIGIRSFAGFTVMTLSGAPVLCFLALLHPAWANFPAASSRKGFPGASSACSAWGLEG